MGLGLPPQGICSCGTQLCELRAAALLQEVTAAVKPALRGRLTVWEPLWVAVRRAHRHPSLLPGCFWRSVCTGDVAPVRARPLCLRGEDPSATPEAGSTGPLGPSRQVSRHELPARQGRRPQCLGPLPTGSWLCGVLLRAQGAEAPAVFRNVSNHRNLRASKFSHGCKSLPGMGSR